MNTFKRLSTFALTFALATFAAFGQVVQLSHTTLSAAVTSGSATLICLSSTTGLVAGPSATTSIWVDQELIAVRLVNTTTGCVNGQRGAAGTKAAAHISGAVAWIGYNNQFFASSPLVGSTCSRTGTTAEPVLPAINTNTGVISDCLGGVWVAGITAPQTPFHVLSPTPGAVAYTSINSSGTTAGATTLYCSEVDLPSNKLLTGIALLNGTTVGTDHRYVVLYDASGNALANSALTGVLTATASVYQQHAFTSTYYAVGPALYYACFQTNTGTDSTRMAVTGTNDNLLTKGQTGATFGTIPTLTVPTGFNTAVGPYVYLY